MTLIDDEEFEHKDPKDNKYNLSSKNWCKESNLSDDMQDFRKMTFEPIPDASSQHNTIIFGEKVKRKYHLTK